VKKLIGTLIALGLGVVLVFAYQAWVLDTTPRQIVVRSVDAAVTPTHDRVLTVRMETDPQPSCFRVGLHILFQESADGERKYAPLSPAVNGLGFATTMATRFSVSMNLPADMGAGTWFYVSRTVFLCPMLLVFTRFYSEQTAPIPVLVPGVG
jgi:hypothetical protein